MGAGMWVATVLLSRLFYTTCRVFIAKGMPWRQVLSTDFTVYTNADATIRRMGVWLCGVCFKTHTLRTRCRLDGVEPPDPGDGSPVRFLISGICRPGAPTNGVVSDILVDPGGWYVAWLDQLLTLRLRTVKTVPPRCRLGFARIFKDALDGVDASPDDPSCWVRLLVLPLCVLRTFTPRSSQEGRAV